VLVVPNLFFIGALLMLLASTTRSIMLVYVGVLAFFVLWIVAGKFTQNIDNEWIAVLTDPFGIRALGRATRYFSTAEANAGLPDIAGYMLANRAVWATVALALFGLTLALFKPQRAGTGKRLFGKAKALAPAASCTGAHRPAAHRTAISPARRAGSSAGISSPSTPPRCSGACLSWSCCCSAC
jgi:ABC-2 type transport system permease protein